MSLLKLNNLTKRFPGVIALNQVSFDLAEGEVHAICGENGAGKSTLIKILSGVHIHGSYEGELQLDGKVAAFKSTAEAEAQGISVIYQELALVEEMTVAENVYLGNEPTRRGRIDWNYMFSETQALLDQFNLRLDPTAKIRDLGVGEQQLVEILKALSKRSRILLLDEPTAALTETEVAVLLEIVSRLKAEGITCVYISHKLDEVFAIADRITVLRDGASIATLETANASKSEVIQHMVGREITDFFPRRADTPGPVIFSVQGLTVLENDRGRTVLEDIGFELRAGEVLGLGGLIGAGRTELLMHILGVFGHRASGQVHLNGEELTAHSPREAIKRGMVLISEDRKRFGLFLDQSIGFNLSISSLKGFQDGPLINANKEYIRNQGFFESLSIKAPSQETVTVALSGGNQQKVVLGKGLMTEPRVVFLDEPTRGIDVGAKVEVYELINQLTDDGKAVLLVSSELPELMGMSDRMIILSEGKIGGSFARTEATQESILAAAMRHHN